MSSAASGAARGVPAASAAPSSGPAACGVDGRRGIRQGAAVDLERRGRQQSFVVGEVQHAGFGAGRRQRFAEQAWQQAVEVVFRGDRHVDVEKAADRPLHAVHGHRQVIDFEHHASRP